MKFFYTLLLIVLILLTACQSASPETTPTLEEIEQPEEQADPTIEPVNINRPLSSFVSAARS